MSVFLDLYKFLKYMERVIIKSGKTLKQKINVLNLKIEFNHLIFRKWVLNKYVFQNIYIHKKKSLSEKQ